MLDFPTTLTSTPPLTDAGRLIDTLPPIVTGAQLKALRKASGMPPWKFAATLMVSPEWLRAFELGRPATLARCLPQTQANVAQGVRLLGVRLTKDGRSEEHTSELQSPDHLVCRLLLEKKK